MRRLSVGLLLLAVGSCASASKSEFRERGKASWYGGSLQGHKTASGEPFDMHRLTAAHRTLPFGTMVCVRSLSTGKEVRVRINDRGPYARHRIIDLSQAAASRIGIVGAGEDNVEITGCP